MLLKEIPSILERQRLPVLPGVIKRLEAMEAKEVAIRSEHFDHTKEKALLAEARREAEKDTEAELKRLVDTNETLTELRQQKARIEAEARGESAMTLKERIENFNYRTAAEQVIETERQQAKANRQQLVAAELPGRLQELRDMTAAHDLTAAYDDVLLTNDGRTVAAVGGAVLRRLRREEAHAPEHQRAALTQERVAFQTRHERWLVLHPSPSAQLRQVDASIDEQERKLRDSHRFTWKFANPAATETGE